MTPEPPSPPVLDYRASAAPHARRLGLSLGLGAVPFGIVVGVFLYELFYGDPPSFEAFKAYHFWIGVAISAAAIWTVAVALRHWQSARWVIVVAVVWAAWTCWVGIWLLREVRAHPAGQWYLSQW